MMDEGISAVDKVKIEAVIAEQKRAKREKRLEILLKVIVAAIVGPLSIAFLVALMVPIDLFSAWVIIKLWGWFLPTISFVPTLWQVFGVLYIFGLLTYKSPDPEKRGKKSEHPFKDLGYMLGSRILASAASLGIGALIVTLFL